MFGVTLAGGGARGAYIAGALRYLYTEIPKIIGYTPWPDLVSGVSVGAINGYFIASHSPYEIKRMTEVWTQDVRIDRIYHLPIGPISFFRNLFQISKRASFLDASPLQKMVENEAGRRGLRHGIHPDRCKAFLVAATEVHSSKNIIFADTASPDIAVPAPKSGDVIRTKIYPHHILASGAIPLVLPPIEIDGKYYFDGGLRQYAPLSPLIHMGANKIMILGTRSEEEEDPPIEPPTPNLSAVGSYALNAMSLDFVDRDLDITRRINRIIDWGVENYGKDFAKNLKRDLYIRSLKPLHLRPSMNLGQLAQQVFDPQKIQADYNTRWLLSWLHETKENFYGDYSLSFLLFDPVYTKAAEQLGFEDTQKREEELVNFFTQPSWLYP